VVGRRLAVGGRRYTVYSIRFTVHGKQTVRCATVNRRWGAQRNRQHEHRSRPGLGELVIEELLEIRLGLQVLAIAARVLTA
jgi:hypothetical protein